MIKHTIPKTIGYAGVTVISASLLTGCLADPLDGLDLLVENRARDAGAEVGFYFHHLGTGDTVSVTPRLRMHAASTMKVPVMIQIFRDAEAGRFALEDSIPVKNLFYSVMDSSEYSLDMADDSDSTLYDRIGDPVSIREMTELMIISSSNLATNILIEAVGADRVQNTMRTLGADSIEVVRGVEDLKAYEAGLSNTTTAHDLGVIFTALAEGRAAGPAATREMLDILARQEFDDGIPAGLPVGARVAHKTGTITEINHDAGIVFLEDGTRYVLVVLTRGVEDARIADQLIADISAGVYEAVDAMDFEVPVEAIE